MRTEAGRWKEPLETAQKRCRQLTRGDTNEQRQQDGLLTISRVKGQNSVSGLQSEGAEPPLEREGREEVWGDLFHWRRPIWEHHLGLLLSLLGPIQHEAKTPVDYLTLVRSKRVFKSLLGPNPAQSRQKHMWVWNILEVLFEDTLWSTSADRGYTLMTGCRNLMVLCCPLMPCEL